ncbi:MAG: hypothetical protein PHO70_06920 [Candidatus Omnitrophica bacterium]|nr:hypothetical protein [Candidatus Omnitrophota bacterium]
MKKIILLALGLVFVSSLAFAQGDAMTSASKPVAAETMTLSGVIIDNACAQAQKPEALAEFVKTHPKSCALMPACVASGYSIYADGSLMKFDNDSNAKIAEFLKKEDSKLAVVVEVKKNEGGLSLISIKN